VHCTGDPQWIRVAVERARKVRLSGGPVVYGYLTLSPRVGGGWIHQSTGEIIAMRYRLRTFAERTLVPVQAVLEFKHRIVSHLRHPLAGSRLNQMIQQ
jgi:hypothetical protein